MGAELLTVGSDTLSQVYEAMCGFQPKKKRTAKPNGQPYQLDDEERRLLDAMDHIPNDGDWEEWNTKGMAIHRVTGGSEAGFRAFVRLSAQSASFGKVDAATGLAGEAYCRNRWEHWRDHADRTQRRLDLLLGRGRRMAGPTQAETATAADRGARCRRTANRAGRHRSRRRRR